MLVNDLVTLGQRIRHFRTSAGLTLDQLGRAATLICALEGLRRRQPGELGNARFTVGLWVGASATANNAEAIPTPSIGESRW